MFGQSYRKILASEATEAMQRMEKEEILTKEDLGNLPEPVQKYMKYVGVIGKPKIQNFRVEFDGRIRQDEKNGWMKFKSVQYNFINQPTRIFYIKARKMGIHAVGLHLYKNQTASMEIKMAGLFKIVDARGKEMNQGETVTVFNDMCFMAPASLIDKNIQWEVIDSLTVNARYTNGNITIGATLFFNDKGELTNFMSNDRFETKDGIMYKNYPWITPVKEYKEMNGYRMPSFAQAIYQRPEGNFCYGEFRLIRVEYNCKSIY